MRISAKTHYATSALIELSLRGHDSPLSLPMIAESQNISLSYLEQLFARLRRKGLVTSARGRDGGYILGMSPGEISIACIADAVDESFDSTRCGGQSNCQGGEICLTHYLWTDLSSHIHHFLEGVKLLDLIGDTPYGLSDKNLIPSRTI